MLIEILHIAQCPNSREAGERLRAALDTLDGEAVAVPVQYRLVTASTVIEESAFAGSPTFLVDGRDLFPSDGATHDLACRVYVSGGRLAGLPSVDDLVDALRAWEVQDAQG